MSQGVRRTLAIQRADESLVVIAKDRFYAVLSDALVDARRLRSLREEVADEHNTVRLGPLQQLNQLVFAPVNIANYQRSHGRVILQWASYGLE